NGRATSPWLGVGTLPRTPRMNLSIHNRWASTFRTGLRSPSIPNAERLSADRLPDDYVRDHDELRVDGSAGRGIWTTQAGARSQGVTLTRPGNLVRLVKLENQLGEQVALLPPLLVHVFDEVVVGVRHALELAGEYVEHFDMPLRPAQEPEAKLAHER